MAKKGFLYGMGFGILCCNVYPLFKGNLRTTAVKIVEGALSAEKTTKSFMEEVHEKALERRQERFKKTADDNEAKPTKDNSEIYESIEFLKKQIEEMKSKMNGT